MAGTLPSARTGHLLIASAVAFLAIGAYVVLLSALLPQPGIWVLDALRRDTHYKYFALLIIPTTSYFAIANWVGWQFFMNS